MTAEPIAQPIPSVPARARASASAAAPALKDLVAHAIVQRRVISQPYAGLMHMLIFWGVTIQVLGTAVNLMQMRLFTPWVLDTFPRGPAYLGYELVMDLAGVAILLGVAMAAFRRIVLRPRTLPNTLGDFYPLVLLTLLPLAGFLAESMRLLAVAPPWARWSPAGNLVAHWLAAAGMTPAMAVRAHDPMVWLHAILGMTLLASIPFTKLRHVAMTPLFIAVRTRLRPGTLPLVEDFEQAESLGVGTVREFDSKSLMAFDACLQCGRCTAACPMYLAGMPYAPHALLRDLRSVMVDGLVHADSEVADAPLVGSALDQGSPWFCTTCGACVSQCPALIRPVDSFVDLRRYGVMTSGELPKTIADTLRNLERQGNPWGMPPEDRAQRARDLGLGVLGPGDETDVLFYMGCAAAYDERTAKSVRAFVRLMKEAGVQVAVLADETCCGEQARRLGHEWMFQEMAKQNLESLASVKYRQIVTQCPHCFNTMRHEYAQMGAHLDVIHYTEFLESIRDRLPLRAAGGGDEEVARPLVYHDSCYLGRYNGVYAAPRRLLDSVGARRTEMRRSGPNSLCCGGGGGQMWQETPPDQRINNLRLKDAVDAGAAVVATACPYCLLMFDDAIRSTDQVDRVRVLDVAEVLAARLPAQSAAAQSGNSEGPSGDAGP